MKNIYLLTVSFLLFHIAQAQYTAIPDQNFEQALIDLGYDNIIDGQVLTSNISGVTFLDISSLSIQDLTGIQDFAALTQLLAWDNLLTSLNISQNTTIEYLFVGENPLATLDVSNNTNLIGIGLWDCNFTSLDLTNNINLEFLIIDDNPLATLDISNNLNLVVVSADFTNLTALNTSNNPNLQFLYLWDCNISTLDLSNNINLIELDVDENNLTQLDLSNNPNLEILYCADNYNLSFIDLKNGNTAGLQEFYAYDIANNACIQVDDAQAASNGTTYPYNQWDVDPTSRFSEDCTLSTVSFTKEKLRFFPNPTTDKITILNTNITSYEVYDSKGSTVIINSKFTNNSINVAFLKPGVYFINAYNDKNESQSIRFIKK